MPSLLDLALNDDSFDSQPTSTEEVSFREPATVRLFTPEFEEIHLHYEKEEEHRGYYRCLAAEPSAQAQNQPGQSACPTCQIGSAPNRSVLVPVYDYAAQEVRPLRISRRGGAGTLLPEI